jgi:hypothetical protein
MHNATPSIGSTNTSAEQSRNQTKRKWEKNCGNHFCTSWGAGPGTICLAEGEWKTETKNSMNGNVGVKALNRKKNVCKLHGLMASSEMDVLK